MEPKNVEAEVLTEQILTERRDIVKKSAESAFNDEWKYWIWDNIKRGVPKDVLRRRQAQFLQRQQFLWARLPKVG